MDDEATDGAIRAISGALGSTELENRTCVEPGARSWNFRSLGAPWSRADAYLIAGIGAASVLFALWYLPAYRVTGVVPPAFYQAEFGPAVMQACGRGFVNVDVMTAPALHAFLDQRVDRLRCEELPEAVRVVPLGAFQGTSRYLMGPRPWSGERQASPGAPWISWSVRFLASPSPPRIQRCVSCAAGVCRSGSRSCGRFHRFSCTTCRI